jgi:hypothetical protein
MKEENRRNLKLFVQHFTGCLACDQYLKSWKLQISQMYSKHHHQQQQQQKQKQ